MKKRLLALALCLVLMTSLLPMIAYGDNPDLGVYITGRQPVDGLSAWEYSLVLYRGFPRPL